MIGIVGGVGPYAGLDLLKKIFDSTSAKKDQEHLSIILISEPQRIEDRTEFIVGNSSINPGYALGEIACKLADAGAKYIGIPCNSAHSPEIFNITYKKLKDHNSSIVLVNMITEVGIHLKDNYNNLRKVGLLSTTGTLRSKVYSDVLKIFGIELVQVDDQVQDEYVHPAIYDEEYGIKSKSNPVTEISRNNLLMSINSLKDKGVKVIILGCTEIPLAIPEKEIGKVTLVDPTEILAQSLIKLSNPLKLQSRKQ